MYGMYICAAAGLAQLRQGGLTSTDQILVAEKAGAWSEALALYEQALSQEAGAAASASSTAAQAAAGDDGGGSSGRVGAAAADVLISAACAVVSGLPSSTALGGQQQRLSMWSGLEQLQPVANLAGQSAGAEVGAAGESTVGLLDASRDCISSLQGGQLRCLLQMGHQQTLLRQVDGLMARSLGRAATAARAVAVTPAAVAGQADAAAVDGAAGALQAVQWSLGQLSALGVAAAWRLGAWDQLRGYLSVLEAAGNSPAGLLRPLSAADRWEVREVCDRLRLCWCIHFFACGQRSGVVQLHRESRAKSACYAPVVAYMQDILKHGCCARCAEESHSSPRTLSAVRCCLP